MAAVLIPLAAFAVEAIFIRQLKRFNAYLATGAIGLSCLLSLIGFLDYGFESELVLAPRAESQAAEAAEGPAARARRRGSAAHTAAGLVRAVSTG